MQSIHWLALAGALVIIALAIYALTLWRRVWRLERERKAQQLNRNTRLAGDVRFLAESLLDDRVPMVEGAIRIKVLLDNYTDSSPELFDLEIFETIYESTAHIPTHRAWKELPSSEREMHWKYMETLERDHKARVRRAAQQLVDTLK